MIPPVYGCLFHFPMQSSHIKRGLLPFSCLAVFIHSFLFFRLQISLFIAHPSDHPFSSSPLSSLLQFVSVDVYQIRPLFRGDTGLSGSNMHPPPYLSVFFQIYLSGFERHDSFHLPPCISTCLNPAVHLEFRYHNQCCAIEAIQVLLNAFFPGNLTPTHPLITLITLNRTPS